MKDSELDQLLQTVKPAQRDENYWQRLPKRVLEQVRLRPQGSPSFNPSAGLAKLKSGAPRAWIPSEYAAAFAISAGVVCLFIAGVLLWRHAPEPDGQQLAMAKKYYQEISVLFPHQLRGISFDRSGAHLDLAETATVPASPPIYLKVCERNGCRHFITFSGQQIRIGTEVCDVLMDHRGAVLLVGQSLLWSSSAAARPASPYRIEVKELHTSS